MSIVTLCNELPTETPARRPRARVRLPRFLIIIAAAVAGFLVPTLCFATVVIPVPTNLNLTYNTCDKWEADITYTATTYDDSAIDVLRGATYWDYKSHYHIDYHPFEAPAAVLAHSFKGSPSTNEKLRTINDAVFNTSDPIPGMTATYHVSHWGGCATEQQRRECVGIMLGTKEVQEYPNEYPITLPLGMCAGVPPAYGSCSFTTASAHINLGVGGPGSRSGYTDVRVECTQPIAYTLSLVPLQNETDGIQINDVLAQGQRLPYNSNGAVAAETLRISVDATVTRPGSLSSTSLLLITYQ